VAETAKTADRALAVLTALAEHGPMTPAQVSEALGLNRTVAHRLLVTLQERGFVMRPDGGYRPGPALIRVAASDQHAVAAAARSTMARLSTELDETVVLHVVDSDQALVLEQVVAAHHVVRVEHAVGSRTPLAKGASGRVLLAYMSSDMVGRLVADADEIDRLSGQLAAIRQLGHAMSKDELQSGTSGLAVPVRDQCGTVVASLAVLAPTMRATRMTDFVAPLEKASAAITAALPGYC
jgi:DNA-binding IclR family transcriptional regulator